MKLSDFIQQLNEVKEEYGDLDLHITDQYNANGAFLLKVGYVTLQEAVKNGSNKKAIIKTVYIGDFNRLNKNTKRLFEIVAISNE